MSTDKKKLDGYLVVKYSPHARTCSGEMSARFCKSIPALKPDEVAVSLELNVPLALFTRPQLAVKVDVPDDAVPREKIQADVLDNIKEAIEKQTGMDVSVRLVEPTGVDNGDI